MRKNKKVIISLIIFTLLICMFIWTKTVIHINAQYKNASVVECEIGDILEYEGYEIKVVDYEFMGIDEVEQLVPDYERVSNAKTEDEKIIIVSLEVTKETSDAEDLELDMKSLESGAWSNGLALDILPYLNEDSMNLGYDLEQGDTFSVKLPYNLYSFQFSNEEWENVESREYSLVFGYYPTKYKINMIKD